MKKFTLICLLAFMGSGTLMATDVGGVISSNTIWSSAGNPYIVTSSITVNSGVTLTVETGVIVRFNNSLGMKVYGTLNATGSTFTSNSGSPSPGIWNGLQAGEDYAAISGLVNLSGCYILYADNFLVHKGKATLENTELTNFKSNGAEVHSTAIFKMTGGKIETNSSQALSYGAGLFCGSGSFDTLSGVTIKYFRYGIRLYQNARCDLTDMTISNCYYPIYYENSAGLTLHGTNNFSSGNTFNAVYMYMDAISDYFVLPSISLPYYFPYGLTVNAGGTLEIPTGSILKFGNYRSLNVYGTLIANALAPDTTYFTSYLDDNLGGDTNGDGSATAPSTSNWIGIVFQNPSLDAGCLLNRCKVQYAGYYLPGTYQNGGGISMIEASPTVDSCVISECYFGIYMSGASNPVLTYNNIGSSSMTPLAMSIEANPVFLNNTFSFSNNQYDAIGLISGELSINSVLYKRNVTGIDNITYLLLGDIIVPSGKLLTINQGIVIKSYSYDHRIIINGTMIADGTADSLITFTSAKDDNYGNPADCNKDGTLTYPEVGNWGGIIFNSGSAGSLNYCRLLYARNIFQYSSCSESAGVLSAGLSIIDASPAITNCQFTNLKYGIACHGISNPVIYENTFTNITYTPVSISCSSNPVFTGNDIETNVGLRAIGLLGGHVCNNGTIRKREVAGYENITYVLLGNLYIDNGTYINVEAGVVIKVLEEYGYYYDDYNIFVDGGFRTDGTAAENVVITSLRDDNEGNPPDCNGDGNATNPAANDWGIIKFRATSDDGYCVLAYTKIKYGCYVYYPYPVGYGSVMFENAGGRVVNSSIISSGYNGIHITGSSTPIIDQVTIQNCDKDPIMMSLLSNPTFSNITFNNNESNAIKIAEGTLSSAATLISRDVAGFTNIAYVIDNLEITSSGKLTIQPGVIIKFRNDGNSYYTNIKVYGKLIARGTPSQKIVFTSYKDDSRGGDSNNNGSADTPERYDWKQIYFSGSVNDTLSYCELAYTEIGLVFDNAHAVIDQCLIEQIDDYAIDIIGSSNPDIRNTQFYNITLSPVRLSMFSNPSFLNCNAYNVGRMALTVRQETYALTATIPVRSFAGYDNITYYLEGICTINSGTIITIPAGIVFKTNRDCNYGEQRGFVVNGGLNILGSESQPVCFTDYRDDNLGNPPDMNQDGGATQPPGDVWYENPWITFNNIADDGSLFQYATFKYGYTGINLISASPDFDHMRFEKLTYGMNMTGVSEPGLTNSVFHNTRYPMQVSLVAYLSAESDNELTGSTWKVIKVRNETLTQDMTLPKRSFAGVPNIVYLFDNYTIGTGAILTIDSGVVCKFINNWNSGLYVNKGLKANGGFEAEKNIVFTDYRDDFYGGDSNADSTASTPQMGSWGGITFNEQSIDPYCSLSHCIIKYGYNGVRTDNASPSFTYCSFLSNMYGIYATAVSDPEISHCDFDGNYYWAVNNVNKYLTMNAENCWWGSNLGPIQTDVPGDGTSPRELVTSAVDYIPFSSSGATNPIMGDVSLNGLVQAYDASLVLKHTVGLITLNATQQEVADVTATGGISAFDASYILRYTVGLIQYFPAELLKSAAQTLNDAYLTVGGGNFTPGTDILLPVTLMNAEGTFSLNSDITYDPIYLTFLSAEPVTNTMNFTLNHDETTGLIRMAMAGTEPLNGDPVLVFLAFRVNEPVTGMVSTMVGIQRFLANESDLTINCLPGIVMIDGTATGTAQSGGTDPVQKISLYPNPTEGDATLHLELNRMLSYGSVELYDLAGRRLSVLYEGGFDRGTADILLSRPRMCDAPGCYILKINIGGHIYTRMLIISR